MASSQAVTFKAEPDRVWGAVLKIVSAAGYTITETNAAARQIKYDASGDAWAWAQTVTVSVAGITDNETLVTVNVEAKDNWSLTEGSRQRQLIKHILDELSTQFPAVAVQPQQAGTPNTSGCFGLLLLLIGVAGLHAVVSALLEK